MEECYFLVKLQGATLLKVPLLHGCFSRFLNYKISSKLRRTSPIKILNTKLQKTCKKDVRVTFSFIQ